MMGDDAVGPTPSNVGKSRCHARLLWVERRSHAFLRASALAPTHRRSLSLRSHSRQPLSRSSFVRPPPDSFTARRTTSPTSGTGAPSTSESHKTFISRAATPRLIWPPAPMLPTHPSHAALRARPPQQMASNHRREDRVPLFGFFQCNTPRAHHERQLTSTSATGQLPASNDHHTCTSRSVSAA